MPERRYTPEQGRQSVNCDALVCAIAQTLLRSDRHDLGVSRR
jgi:hypothetical protein